jgi:hypothetical protein
MYVELGVQESTAWNEMTQAFDVIPIDEQY